MKRRHTFDRGSQGERPGDLARLRKTMNLVRETRNNFGRYEKNDEPDLWLFAGDIIPPEYTKK